MEGRKHHNIEDNLLLEDEKCCRGCKLALAALGNAGGCFFVEGRVLRSGMVPRWCSKIAFGTSFFDNDFGMLLDIVFGGSWAK